MKNVTIAMDKDMLNFLAELGRKIGTNKTATTIKGCVKIVSYLEKFTDDETLVIIDKRNNKEINILFKG